MKGESSDFMVKRLEPTALLLLFRLFPIPKTLLPSSELIKFLLN